MYNNNIQYHQAMLQRNMQIGQQQAMMNHPALAGASLAEPRTQDIDHPGMNDVMCGRGGGTNNHIGNIRFRQLVNGHKLRYLAATKSEKPMVSREVVTIWRSLVPPGRFLKQQTSADGKSGLWSDVGDKKAREKASQCLRERTPDVVPFMKKLELQISLQEQEVEAKKKGVTVKQTVDGKQVTAAELSKELLKEQQEATIKAHMALEAFIPASIVSAHAPDMKQNALNIMNMQNMQNNNMGMYQANHSGIQQQNNHHIAPAPAPNNSLNEQRERLAREIAQLQQQQEHLEAIARITKQQSHQNTRASPPILPQATNVNALPTAEQLLKTLDQPINPEHLFSDVANNNKSQRKDNYRDEYRQSVIEIMGTKHSSRQSIRSSKSGGKSESGRSVSTIENNKPERGRNITRKKSDEKSTTSTNSNAYMDLLLKNSSYDRDSEFETRSQNSWMGGIKLNTFDDMSMTSSTILSPGNSVKHNFQTDDLEPEPLHPRDYNDSRETITTSNHVKKSEKSLSSFECAILDSMISPANIGGHSNFALPNIYEGQNHAGTGMPPPRSRLPNQKSNTSMLSAGSSRPTLHEHKESSNVSMMSDLTDGSLSKKDSISLSKYSHKFSKTKSDNSMGMSDNISDISEAMGSLDMK